MARLAQVLLFGYWAALFIATHVPVSVPQVAGRHSDKVVHVAAYAVLSCLIAITWQLSAGGCLGGRHYRRIGIVLALYAAFDEATQLLVGRDGNWPDWLADVMGIALGLAIFHFVVRPLYTKFCSRGL
jgi:VanZ family protein